MADARSEKKQSEMSGSDPYAFDPATRRYLKIRDHMRELRAHALGLRSAREYSLLTELIEAKYALAKDPFDDDNVQWLADVIERFLKA
jgi:hypothetical protein